MAYKAVLESRREAEDKFRILAEALRLNEERAKKPPQKVQGKIKGEDRYVRGKALAK